MRWLLLFLFCTPAFATTWYIRTDGGTATQCTGTTNAAYPGSGSAQACAFNHPYWMIASGGTTWAHMVGGDTIQFVKSGTSDTYYMGEQNGGLGFDWNGNGLSSICPSPNTGGGAGTSCILPAFPSGTASQHTRILGQNVGSCHDSGHTHLVNPTILSGINTVFAVLDTRATNYIDISCIAITQPDTCTGSGAGLAGNCGTNANNVKYGGIIFGFSGSQGPSNLTLTDVAVVGLAGDGILGSHNNVLSTDTVTYNDVYIIGNGHDGDNGDDGTGGTGQESVGTININHSIFDWNGCVAVKPYDFTKPDTQNAYNYCYGQSQGGAGDNYVQIAAGALTLNVHTSFFRWGVQDGFDALHLNDDTTTNPVTHIDTSWAEGNAGATFKIGASSSSSAINNVSIGNCRALSTASLFPLNPTGWQMNGADNCRANGDEWSLSGKNGGQFILENNTSLGYGNVMYDFGCVGTQPTCYSTGGVVVIFRNNISKGYPDAGNGGKFATGIFWEDSNGFANAGSIASNNLWNTMDSASTGCPDLASGGLETAYQCGDPALVGETNINAINPNLTSGSSTYVIGKGVTISGITTDYNGNSRPGSPSIGAFELVGSSSVNAVVGGAAKIGGRGIF